MQEVPNLRHLRVLTDATCTGLFADQWLAAIQDSRLFKVRAKAVVLATGCVEQPMVFRHNDLPGVMLASAAQRLLRLWGVSPGRQAVVVTAGAEGYEAALDLQEAGVAIRMVLDLRAAPASVRRARASWNGAASATAGPSARRCRAVPGPGSKALRS